MIDKIGVLCRLKEMFNSRSDAELARFLGIAPTTLSNWKSRDTIDYDLVFSKCEGVDLHWLLTGSLQKSASPAGHSALFFPKDNQQIVATAIPSSEGIPLIPLEAVAGFCSGNSAQVMGYECEKYLVPNFRGAEFLIKVKGDSMYPKYSNGDTVACKCLPLDTFFQWNRIYVVDTVQGVLIKRVRPGQDDEHILLVSENDQYPPFQLHRSEIFSLAIVIGVICME